MEHFRTRIEAIVKIAHLSWLRDWPCAFEKKRTCRELV